IRPLPHWSAIYDRGGPWNLRFRSSTFVTSQRDEGQQIWGLQASIIDVQDKPIIGWTAFTRQGSLVRSQYRPPSSGPEFRALCRWPVPMAGWYAVHLSSGTHPAP